MRAEISRVMSTVGGRLCFIDKRCPLAQDGRVLFKEGREEKERVVVLRAGPRPRPWAATLSHRCGRNYLSEREVENLGGRTGQTWWMNV